MSEEFDVLVADGRTEAYKLHEDRDKHCQSEEIESYISNHNNSALKHVTHQ
jgi:hypothetical protein